MITHAVDVPEDEPADILDEIDTRARPLPSWRFSRRGWIISALLLFLALIPTALFYPDWDQALFFVSGEKIANGAAHYRDIVEVKPPLIYYIYAASIKIFGDSWRSFRLMDFLLQGFTCFMLIRLVRRASGNDLWAVGSALLYVVLYVALSHDFTAQVECYEGLFVIPAIYLQLFKRRRWGFFLCGLLCGGLFLLKFTLGGYLLVALLAELLLFEQSWRTSLRNSAMIVGGFVAVALLLPIYLLAFDAVHDFDLMNRFLKGYVRIAGPTPLRLVRYGIEMTADFLGDHFTVPVAILTAAGICASLVRPEHWGRRSQDLVRLVRLCTLAIPLLYLTIAAEQKFAPLHFSRLFPFATILAAFGCLTLAGLLTRLPTDRRYAWLVAALLLPFTLALSPLPRYLHHYIGSIVTNLEGEPGYDRYYNAAAEYVPHTEFRDVGDFIDARRKPDDKMYTASGSGGLLHLYAHIRPDFKIYHSAFLIARFAPEEWRDSARSYLLRTQPRFIVVQRGDSMPSMTGTHLSSEEALRLLPQVDSLLRNGYFVARESRWFDIYEHK